MIDTVPMKIRWLILSGVIVVAIAVFKISGPPAQSSDEKPASQPVSKSLPAFTGDEIRSTFISRAGSDWNLSMAGDITWDKLEGPLEEPKQWEKPFEAAVAFLRKHPELLSGFPAGSELVEEKIRESAGCTVIGVGGKLGDQELPGNISMGVCPKERRFWARNGTLPVEEVVSCERDEYSMDEAWAIVTKHRSSQEKLELKRMNKAYVYGSGRQLRPVYRFIFDLNSRPHFADVDRCSGSIHRIEQTVDHPDRH